MQPDGLKLDSTKNAMKLKASGMPPDIIG